MAVLGDHFVVRNFAQITKLRHDFRVTLEGKVEDIQEGFSGTGNVKTSFTFRDVENNTLKCCAIEDSIGFKYLVNSQVLRLTNAYGKTSEETGEMTIWLFADSVIQPVTKP